jgi:hypothetical protein
MWYGTRTAALNYDMDIYDLVRGGRVVVIRQDLTKLEGDRIILQNGQKIKTDVVICGTGYKSEPSFPPEPQDKQLLWGKPVPLLQDNMFPPLNAKADIELLQRFPILSKSPNRHELQPGLTLWRLWRFIAPPSQVYSGLHSLVFLNGITTLQTIIKCELVSLWAYAYLNNALLAKPKSDEEVMYEAALWSRFGKWSRPIGLQGKAADMFLESLPYYDLLLRDLGLRSWIKGWGILGEIFGGWYEPMDYRGLIEEWITLNRDKLCNSKKSV